MLNVTLVGCGAIGKEVLTRLAAGSDARITQLLVPDFQVAEVMADFPHLAVATSLDKLPAKPELLLECAGHGAVVEHVLAALEAGIDCIVCSIGALAADGLPERLEAAARQGQAKVQLISGAIGGIDTLAAASIDGLSRVTYTGRKPPLGWEGTPAEDTLDLNNLTEATVFYRGSARQAARLFPKNANVAATVSLAGLGLDDTRVELIADPAVTRNTHQIHAEGGFGELNLTLANFTLPSNPKTSALTVYSAMRAVRNYARPVMI